MATIEEALRTLATADATVASLVSGRVYPLFVPEAAALPAVAYQRIGTDRGAAHTKTAERGLTSTLMQYACVASTFATAHAVSNALRGALDQYRGTASGVSIDAIHAGNELEQYQESSDRRVSSFTVFLDCTVWYIE